jgi:hypothetical protein
MSKEVYSPREASPSTVAEAIIYATYYYNDSGWSAFINGWCFGHGMTSNQIMKLKVPGRPKMIEWANKEIRKVD